MTITTWGTRSAEELAHRRGFPAFLCCRSTPLRGLLGQLIAAAVFGFACAPPPAGEDAGSCLEGKTCTSNPGGPCRLGVIGCATGAPVCADQGNTAAGAACGGGQVCDGSGSCIACAAGTECDTGVACTTGAISCDTGAPVCRVADLPFATICDGGLCNGGACLGPTAVASAVDLSEDPISPGRACAESPAYPVAQVTADGVRVAPIIDAGCLAAGDEVLLVNLQGSPQGIANVGAFETHRIVGFDAGFVVFDSAVARAYGNAAGSQLGVADGGQRVMLLRVPRLGALTLTDAGILTAAAWNGSTGGVVALSAARLELDGVISADKLGYRGGDWSRDTDQCVNSVQTMSGESIAGKGFAAPDANYGGSGGIGPGTQIYHGDTPVGATPGHAQAGLPGGNYQSRLPQEPGAAYGSGDGGTLTMGSGPGGNLTCGAGGSGPELVPMAVRGGGIVLLRVGTLTLGPSGRISSTGGGFDSRAAAAGGTIMIRGDVLELGVARVNALGAVEPPFNSVTTPTPASPGYVVIFYQTSISGTTTPPAFSARVTSP